MTIYAPNPPSVEPEAHLTGWRVYAVNIPALGKETHHFAGYNTVTRDGRVSSPIQSFDRQTGVGVTRSGRFYELHGEPGNDGEASWVWGVWCRRNGIDPINSARDVSEEYVSAGVLLKRADTKE